MIKTKGYELKQFIDDDRYWPNEYYYEYDECIVDGQKEEGFIWNIGEIRDDAIIIIKGGIVRNGKGEIRMTLDKFFWEWKKRKNATRLIIEFGRDEETEMRYLLRQMGVKVI